MSIYLIRHTTPLVDKGICYGQSDLDVTGSFAEEAAVIRGCLPAGIRQVYSSPLLRCRKLAEHLFPDQAIHWEGRLMEIHCGQWELQHWDDIPRHEIDPWMNDFVNISIPEGESYLQLYDRVVRSFEEIRQTERPVAVVTHGGVIRSILAHISDTPLKDSFKVFRLHYGCVVRLTGDTADRLQHEVLSNIEAAGEQHKPSGFKRD